MLSGSLTARPPYPPSKLIREMALDWSTHKRDAIGSDNWQLTWADDDHLYGAWGDGGGFGGTNSDGRVSLGFARVEGDWTSYKGVNLWGGRDALNPATFEGKSWGTICVDGVLYMWVSPKSLLPDMQSEARLCVSHNHGASWNRNGWAFTREDGLSIPTVCQFGRDYAGARDKYVYHYFIAPRESGPKDYRIQKPGAIHLARTPKRDLLDRNAYEFRSGNGWTRDVTRKTPVFEDRENGTGWVCSVSYNGGLKRYILMVEHSMGSQGYLGVYEARQPWGPWFTVHFATEPFGAWHVPANCFFWNTPTKWISRDGREFTLLFTGAGRGKDNDSFNLIRGRYQLHGDKS